MSKTFAQSSSVFLDKVFVLGGIKSGSDSSNEVWVFD